ncbi:MAG TPA: type II toxin-antitoxin system PemK/MazF family toxin [Candidatus Methanoperedens sp.]|nr:type II toxin-antitoxin system PemK/MazF family toxin [Candidatus Methanoperedens sp.]
MSSATSSSSRFPSPNQTAGKQRPAVVVSSAVYNRERLDLVLLAITSQIRPTLGFGEALVTQWKQAGLIKPGVFKPVLTTIERGLVIRKLGRLMATDQTKLREVLDTILG